MRGNRRSSQTTPESRRDEIAKYLRFRRHLDVFWASDAQAEWNRNRIQRAQENPVACNWEKRKRSPAEFCRAGASTNRRKGSCPTGGENAASILPNTAHHLLATSHDPLS
jgi:hypothetical protein